MPPAAMASRLVVRAARARSSPRARPRRRAPRGPSAGGTSGAPPNPPHSASDAAERARRPRRRRRRSTGRSSPGATSADAAEGAGELVGLLEQLVALGVPELVDALAQLDEADHPAAALLREVGAGEERPAVGRAEHRHRPAALAGHGLGRLHVDGVDVGPLLAVDLHVDEERGSSPRRRRRPRSTRGPSRGTSGRPSSRSTAGSGRRARRRRRTPRRPTGTSRPGCRRAGAGRGWPRAASRFTRSPYEGAAGVPSRPWRSRWRARSRWSPVRRGASARRSRRRTRTPGASVLLSSRKLADLEAAAAEIGGDVDVTVANAGDPDQAAAAVDRCIERFGGVDILVNNAATNPYMGPTMDIDLPRYDKTWEVNLRGALVWTQLAWKRSLRERGGSVINIASVGGLSVEPSIGIYNATKAALLHLTRTLAAELAPDVRVNAIAPGLVKTDMARALWEPNEARIGRVDAARPPRRAGRHRQRGAVPRQRPGLVDHRADAHRRRRRAARPRGTPRRRGADAMGRRDPDPRPPIEIVGAEPATESLAAGLHRSPRPATAGRAGSGRGGRASCSSWSAGSPSGVATSPSSGAGDEPDEERDNSAKLPLKRTTTTRSRPRRPARRPRPPPSRSVRCSVSRWARACSSTAGPAGSSSTSTRARGRTSTSRREDPYGAVAVRGRGRDDRPGRDAGGELHPIGPAAGTSATRRRSVPPTRCCPRGARIGVWLVDGGGAVQRGRRASPSDAQRAARRPRRATMLRSFAVDGPVRLAERCGDGVILERGGRVYLADEQGVRPIAVGCVRRA